MKQRMMISITLLALMLTSLVPARATFARDNKPKGDSKPGPPVTKTKLEVKEFSGDFEQWVKKLTINSAGALTFSWMTDEQGVASAAWMVLDKPYSSAKIVVQAGSRPNVIASGVLSKVPAKGHVSLFNINFETFAPKTPPKTPQSYWVYVLPKDAKQESAGLHSTPVEIVYVKYSQPPVHFDDDTPNKPVDYSDVDCKKIENQIKALEAKRLQLSNDLKETKSPYFAGEIKDINIQIAALKKKLDQCMLAHGHKLDLYATFTGKATLTTNNSDAKGPFIQSISASVLFFKYYHDHFNVTGMPPIVVGPFDTPIGDNKTTVTLKGGVGSFNPSTGAMTLNLKLHFHHSLALAKDSDLNITLSTASGSPLDSAGKITLSGSAKFKDGYLDGNTCTLVIKGTITPRP